MSNKEIHLTSAGNAYNGCLYILREKGCSLSSEDYGDEGLIYRAEKDGATFAADSPVELLGLYTLWESLGVDWNHQDPNILDEVTLGRYIVEIWGDKSLVNISKLVANELNISKRSKNFLVEVGLPSEEANLSIRFLVEQDRIIRLSEIYTKNSFCLGHFKNLLVIGIEEDKYYLCIDETHDSEGKVVSVDLTSSNPSVRFVNSNIVSFCECLTVYRELKIKAEEADVNDEKIYSLLAQRLKIEINEVDSEALSSKENWWYLIIEKIQKKRLSLFGIN